MTRRSRISYSQEEMQWLQRNCTKPIADYHSGFCAEFSRTDLTAEQLSSLRKYKGWRTGRTGHFEKGMTCRGKNIRLPIGTERVHHGYLWRKIHDGLPARSQWRPAHILNWEELHGPVPDGMVLKCVDGDRLNTDPSNWEALPLAMMPPLNGRYGRGYDKAPAELKPTIIAVAKLEHQLRERGKKSSQTK